MGTYSISVTRISYYTVEAETEDEAIDKVLDGEVEEDRGETTNVSAYVA